MPNYILIIISIFIILTIYIVIKSCIGKSGLPSSGSSKRPKERSVLIDVVDKDKELREKILIEVLRLRASEKEFIYHIDVVTQCEIYYQYVTGKLNNIDISEFINFKANAQR